MHLAVVVAKPESAVLMAVQSVILLNGVACQPKLGTTELARCGMPL